MILSDGGLGSFVVGLRERPNVTQRVLLWIERWRSVRCGRPLLISAESFICNFNNTDLVLSI